MRWLPAAILLAVATPVRAEIRVERDGVDDSRHKIVISGEIALSTLVDFSQALTDPRVAGAKSLLVELESPGGSLTSAMAIGELVREGGLNTGVAERGKCYSACVLILAAGVHRSVATGKVGVHRPYYDRGLHSPEQPPMPEGGEYGQVVTGDVQRYLESMGMRDGLMEAMMKVPSKFMRHLTSREVAVYGLDNTVPCKIVEVPAVETEAGEEAPLPVAKRFSIKKSASQKTALRTKKKTTVAKRNTMKSVRKVVKVTGPWGRVATLPATKRVKRAYFVERS